MLSYSVSMDNNSNKDQVDDNNNDTSTSLLNLNQSNTQSTDIARQPQHNPSSSRTTFQHSIFTSPTNTIDCETLFAAGYFPNDIVNILKQATPPSENEIEKNAYNILKKLRNKIQLEKSAVALETLCNTVASTWQKHLLHTQKPLSLFKQVAINWDKSYKVSFTNQPDSKKEKLEPLKCQITISVGQSHRHEGPHLLATLLKIKSSYPGGVVIMVDDSLQAYTIAIKDKTLTTMQQCIEKAISLGDDWIRRNLPTIKKVLGNDAQVVRWKDWADTDRQKAIEIMRQEYNKDSTLREEFSKTAQKFVEKRCEISSSSKDYKHAMKHCIDYLIEECAGMMNFWVTYRCHHEAYPANRTEAMAVTHKKFIAQQHPGLLLPLTLSFHHKKGGSSSEEKRLRVAMLQDNHLMHDSDTLCNSQLTNELANLTI